MTVPLSGIKVIEFSHMVMGPSCGLILGDLGADVIKIEPPGDGDKTRRLPGSGAGFFPVFNRNKRSLAIDLKSPKGIALVKKLIAGADVVIENFRPGALDALGLSYDMLKSENPGLIYCSLKGFLSGPYEHRAALDEVVQMMGGLAYMTGPPGRPLRAGAPVNDMMGGMFAAIAIMAAVIERGRTGRGQLVKSALFENNVWLVAPHMAQYVVTGQVVNPMPARISAWAVYDVFETADEPIFVGVVTDTQWAAFCKEFERPDLVTEALSSNPKRVAEREHFLPILRTMFKALTRDEIAGRCERIGLPYAPVMRPHDLFDDPHLAEPGAMTEVSYAAGKSMRVPALPVEMDGHRLGRRLDAPRVGEHSEAIARELGLGTAEVQALIDDKIIGVADK